MNRLPEETIEHLAQRFVLTCHDSVKQEMIDQLGYHPVNHAMFALTLERICGGQKRGPFFYAWEDYLHLTKGIDLLIK